MLARAVLGTAKGILPSPVHLSLPALSSPPYPESIDSFEKYKPKGTLVPQSGLLCLSAPPACPLPLRIHISCSLLLAPELPEA